MPAFSYTPVTSNDISSLRPGLHPAFLLAILDEEVPDGWEMKAKNSRMWRWRFAVWADEAALAQGAKPERQSVVSSQTFSPGGKYQPSKAYVWTCALLGRRIGPGESVDLDPLLPLACQVLVTRTKKDGTPVDYANIMGLEAWPDGQRYVTPDFAARLATLLADPAEAPAPQQAAPLSAAYVQAAFAHPATPAPPVAAPAGAQPCSW